MLRQSGTLSILIYVIYHLSQNKGLLLTGKCTGSDKVYSGEEIWCSKLSTGEGNWCSTDLKRRKLVLYCFQVKGSGALLFSGERNWRTTVIRRRKHVLYCF